MSIKTPFPEKEILNLLPPALQNVESQDQWPDFELKNAVVEQVNGALANIFEASAENALTVIGQLQVKEVDRTQFAQGFDSRVDVYIKIENVQIAKFVVDAKHRVFLLVAGKAGWYVLSPRSIYESVFEKMEEDVIAWNMILEICKKTPRLLVSEVFKIAEKQFKLKAGQMKEHLTKSAAFILTNMQRNIENLDWTSQSIYAYLKEIEVQEKIAQLKIESRPKSSYKEPTSSSFGISSESQSQPVQHTTPNLPMHLPNNLQSQEQKPPIIPKDIDDTYHGNNAPLASLGRIPTRGAIKILAEALATGSRTGSLYRKRDVMEEASDDDENRSDDDISRHATGSLRPLSKKARKTYKGNTSQFRNDKFPGIDKRRLSFSQDNEEQQMDDAPLQIPRYQHPYELSLENGSIQFNDNSQSGEGDENIWRCPVTDCPDVIFGAKSPEGQRLIKAHQDFEHTQTIIDENGDVTTVISREATKTSRPIQNLMKLIQETIAAGKMAQARDTEANAD